MTSTTLRKKYSTWPFPQNVLSYDTVCSFFLSFRRAYKRTKNGGAQQDKMLAKLDEKSFKT